MEGLTFLKMNPQHLFKGIADSFFTYFQLLADTNNFLKTYLPLADMDLIPIVENEQGEIVAAAVTMGSISNALRKAKGKLLPWGW